MHHFIVHIVSLLSFVNSLLRSKKQEESSPKIKELFLTREMKKIHSKMEDRLHVHRIQAKQWPSDRHQYLIWTVPPSTPGRGSKSALYLKTEKDSRYGVEIPRLITEQETTLSHVHHRSFLEPRFLKQRSMWLSPKFIFYNFTSKSDSYLWEGIFTQTFPKSEGPTSSGRPTNETLNLLTKLRTFKII